MNSYNKFPQFTYNADIAFTYFGQNKRTQTSQSFYFQTKEPIEEKELRKHVKKLEPTIAGFLERNARELGYPSKVKIDLVKNITQMNSDKDLPLERVFGVVQPIYPLSLI